MTRWAAIIGLVLGGAMLIEGVALAQPEGRADANPHFLQVTATPERADFTGLSAGSIVDWPITVTNHNTVAVDATATLVALSHGPLATSRSGLKISLFGCADGWIPERASPMPAEHHICRGMTTLMAGPLATLDGGRGQIGSIPATASRFYLARVELPMDAGNALQRQSESLSIDITATPTGSAGPGRSGNDLAYTGARLPLAVGLALVAAGLLLVVTGRLRQRRGRPTRLIPAPAAPSSSARRIRRS